MSAVAGQTAVIYTRVSTEEQQARGFSLPTQVEACRAYAARQGYTVAELFSDRRSGETLDRPGLNDLFEYVAQHSVQVLIVYDTDRFSRGGPAHHAILETRLKKYGVRVEYVLGDYNSDSPEAVLSKLIKQSIAWYENQQRGERIRRGKMGKVQSGKYLGGTLAAYGYLIHESNLVIDEEQAVVVRRIFAWTVEGLSAAAIAARLTAEKVPTHRDLNRIFASGKKNAMGVWHASTIKKMLKNETYSGTWHYNTRVRSKVDGKTHTRRRDESDWVTISVPAIIDREIFAAVQAALARRRSKSTKQSIYQFLLRGRIYCACGRRCSPQAHHGQAVIYRCNMRGNPVYERPCDVRLWVSARRLDALVWQAVRDLLLDEQHLKLAVAQQRARVAAVARPLQEQVESVHKARADVEREMGILLDKMLAEEYPRSVLNEHKRELVFRLRAIEEEERRLEAKAAAVTVSTDSELSMLALARQMRTTMDDLVPADRCRIVELLQVRVDALSKTQFKISCLLPLRSSSVQLSNPHATGSGKKADTHLDEMSLGPREQDGFALSCTMDMTQQGAGEAQTDES